MIGGALSKMQKVEDRMGVLKFYILCSWVPPSIVQKRRDHLREPEAESVHGETIHALINYYQHLRFRFNSMVLLLSPSTFFSVGRRRSKELKIVVAGDASTGKSTLIAAMASGSYSESVPPVLPPKRLPHNLFNDSVPLTLIDTPSSVIFAEFSALIQVPSLDKQGACNEVLKQADAVILTYDCEERETFEHLSSYWLPELRRLEVKAPVVVVGCKLDLRDDSRLVSLESFTAQIMQQFKEVVTCIECSAATMYQIDV
ncbi:hypothetical protein PIB30_064372 [Stylosanthes scabra]|uniref:Miro domain-containing protein n=1 Tax=Stylosanthes scabra TaxID=79078 RepID=A0ABU6YKM4_9FABA|nr:hypothetical protein [Stylosanthes scabra]